MAATFAKNTFGHASYAAFRPSYPKTLYSAVLTYHQGPKNICIDLGCGHGVVARYMAKEFNHVIGTDPSIGMVEQAKASTSKNEFPNVEFREGTAEDLPFVEDGTVDLVVAGQAAHWFDYPKLWPEMDRILRKGGTLAFWGYKDHVFVDHPKATEILHRHCFGDGKGQLGRYWDQPGRSILQNLFRDIRPPGEQWEDIRRTEYEPGTEGPNSGEGTPFLSRKLTLGECNEYMRTWSAFHKWKEDHPDERRRSEGGQGDVVDAIYEEMAAAAGWESEDCEVNVEWGTALLMARKR